MSALAQANLRQSTISLPETDKIHLKSSSEKVQVKMTGSSAARITRITRIRIKRGDLAAPFLVSSQSEFSANTKDHFSPGGIQLLIQIQIAGGTRGEDTFVLIGQVYDLKCCCEIFIDIPER